MFRKDCKILIFRLNLPSSAEVFLKGDQSGSNEQKMENLKREKQEGQKAEFSGELYLLSSAVPYSPVAAHKVFESTEMWRKSVLEFAASGPDRSLLPKAVLPIGQPPRKSDPGMLGSRKAAKEAL